MTKFGLFLPNSIEQLETVAIPALDTGKFSWVEIGAWSFGNVRLMERMQEIVRHYHCEVSIHCHFEDVNISAQLPAIREAALSQITYDINHALLFSPQLAVIHAGDIAWFDYLPEEHTDYIRFQNVIQSHRKNHLSTLLESLDYLGEYAAAYGLKLTVENMYFPWELINSPSEAYQVLSELRSDHVGFTLDFGHALASGYNPLEYVDTLGNLIWHTHIHDNDGHYDLHLPIGNGVLHPKPIISKLVEVTPDISLMLELPSKYVADFIKGQEILSSCVPD